MQPSHLVVDHLVERVLRIVDDPHAQQDTCLVYHFSRDVVLHDRHGLLTWGKSGVRVS